MRVALAVVLLLAGCAPRVPAPVAGPARYVVGPGYELGGVWSYPRESFVYDETGLAAVLPDRVGATADGEAFDPAAMTGAHRTLQLPAIVAVTNLENGRQVLVRLNDRGPMLPGRVVGVSRRAAELLGVPAGGTAQVRVQVQSGPSQALRDRLQEGPRGVSAAPVVTVTQEALPAPGGRALARVAAPLPPAVSAESGEDVVPDRLPEAVTQAAARPGGLWLRLGRFGQAGYANAVKSRLSGLPVEVRREGEARQIAFGVRAGPFDSVAAADAALDQARANGVTDAAIVVE